MRLDITRWLVALNQGRIHFLHSFWSSCGYLIHYQSEESCAHHDGHIGPPQ